MRRTRRIRRVKSRALTGRAKSIALSVHHGGRRRARAKLPKPPRLSRAEVTARARRIADRWRREWERPLSGRDLGAIVKSLAVEAAKEHRRNLDVWAWHNGYRVCLATLRRYWLHIPDDVKLCLAAGELERVVYAMTGDREAR